VDPDALRAARLMDFYKADGTLDAAKGAEWLALQDERAGRLADERIAPIRQREQAAQSQANFHMAKQTLKAEYGVEPSDEALRAVWQNLGPDLTSDPRVAGIMGILAAGFDTVRNARKPSPVAPPASAPLLSEPSGGNPRTRPAMSAFEERIAAERGVSASKWQDFTKGYQPGKAMGLED
jgi:hypothetical protein